MTQKMHANLIICKKKIEQLKMKNEKMKFYLSITCSHNTIKPLLCHFSKWKMTSNFGSLHWVGIWYTRSNLLRAKTNKVKKKSLIKSIKIVESKQNESCSKCVFPPWLFFFQFVAHPAIPKHLSSIRPSRTP